MFVNVGYNVRQALKKHWVRKQSPSLIWVAIFLAPKVPSYKPFLSHWKTHLTKFFMGFRTRVKSQLYQISEKFVLQGLRYDVSDVTFEAQKQQPKLQRKTLITCLRAT